MTDDLLKAREIVDDMDQAAIFGKAFPIREQIASAIRAARKEGLKAGIELSRSVLTGCDQFHCGHIDCNKFRALSDAIQEKAV